MSIIKKGKRSYRAFLRMLRRICKFLVRQLTQKGELHRAVVRSTASGRGSGLSAKLVADIAKSLARSSQLEEVKSTVFGSRPFAVDDVLETIVRVKKISDSNVIAALAWSLQVSFRFSDAGDNQLTVYVHHTGTSIGCLFYY